MTRAPGDWLLKIRRYDGSESVLWHFDNERSAQAEADARNAAEQTDAYYVERFDPAKLSYPYPRHGHRNRTSPREGSNPE